jgi:hypothetical protein
MKNLINVKAVLRTAGIAALVAAIGFTMIACDSGGGGGGGRRSTPSDPTSATYTSYDSSGIEYKLVITKAAGRAVYSPQPGDTYELTITPPGTKSTGTVESIEGSTINLKQKDNKEFSLTVSGSNIVSFESEDDTIPVDTGNPVTIPEGTLTAAKPDTPAPSGGDGVFTLNDIPEEYNGLYAFFMAWGDDSGFLVGYQSIDLNTNTYTLQAISNGSVSIPVWNVREYINTQTESIPRYSGNGIFDVSFPILDSATLEYDGSEFHVSFAPVKSTGFSQVEFTSGSATKSWYDRD